MASKEPTLLLLDTTSVLALVSSLIEVHQPDDRGRLREWIMTSYEQTNRFKKDQLLKQLDDEENTKTLLKLRSLFDGVEFKWAVTKSTKHEIDGIIEKLAGERLSFSVVTGCFVKAH